MPRVDTVEQVFIASRYKNAQKQQPNLLGVPSLPGLSVPTNSVAVATVEWLFVGPGYVSAAPDEVFAVVTDQTQVTEIDRKHRQLNMDGASPQLSTFTNMTPHLIVRTVG